MPSVKPQLQNRLSMKTGIKTQNSMKLVNTIKVMEMLNVNAQALNEVIHEAISENPALEYTEGRICPVCKTELPRNTLCPKCSYKNRQDQYEPVVFLSPPEKTFLSSKDIQHSTPDALAPQKEDLATYVFKQIANDLKPEDRKLAAFMLSSLDDSGLISMTMGEIVRSQRVPPNKIREVIQLIQSSDPIGVGSLNSNEAMICQVRHLNSQRKIINAELCIQAIQNHTKLIAMKDYSKIAKRMNISKGIAKKISEYIANNLNPYPAHAHWGDERTITDLHHDVYHRPDFIIHVDNQTKPPRLMVEVLYPLYGLLQLNQVYQEALLSKTEPKKQKEKLQQDMDDAKSLINTIDQRNHTLVKFMQYIVSIQHDFILHGEKYLFPITQKEVASKIGVKESTISRAVKDKSVQLPSKKIIPCSSFFEQNLPYRIIINDLIESEDKNKPLSDQKICDYLQNQGIGIARRTVAKYRDLEGHLCASARKTKK